MGVQTSVASDFNPALPGMLADSSFHDVVTAVLQTNTATLAPGRFVSRDDDLEECKLPASVADLKSQTVLGLVLRDSVREPGYFERYDTLSVLRKGRAYAPCEDAFSIGDEIWVRVTAGVGEFVGALRTDSDSGDAFRLPGIILNEGDAGDLALIEINFPYPQEVDELGASTVLSGTYTPTIATGTNTTASGSPVGWYIRVGSVVFFGGRASITHTAGVPTASTFTITLPVASNLGAAGDLAGCVTGEDVSVGELQAETTGDVATASYKIGATGAKRVSWQGSYTVI